MDDKIVPAQIFWKIGTGHNINREISANFFSKQRRNFNPADIFIQGGMGTGCLLYTSKYGPMHIGEVESDRVWNWSKGPWPWEYSAN